VTRKARPEDIETICLALPEVEFGTTWGDVPTYKVPRGGRGRGFLLFRPPGPTAIDPETGEMYDDLLLIVTPTEAEKRALVEDESTPFFTIPHLERSNAVLVQQSRLGELDRAELVEIVTDAWAARAPKGLVRKHLGDG
jgi:hypothetical protein